MLKSGVDVLKGIHSIDSSLRITTPRYNNGFFIQKSKPVSIFSENLRELKLVSDSFQATNYKPITSDEVIGLFEGGKINGSKLRRKMYTIKMILFLQSFLNIKKFKLWLHSIDLSNRLKPRDCELIAHYINLFDGKYANVWTGFSSTDAIPNIEKLALFIRSIKRIMKTDFYDKLDEKTWENCIDGIINRPDEVILPLLEYKFDSSKINRAANDPNASPEILDQVKKIKKFLDSQRLKYDITVYRGEGGFEVFDSVKLDDKNTLKPLLEEFTRKIKSGSCTQKEIDEFIDINLINQRVTQSRFMSTAIEPSSIENYAKEIYWEIYIPANSKASMIEGYNVERESESEILVQKGSKLLIKEAKYDFGNKRWYIKAELEQGHLE